MMLYRDKETKKMSFFTRITPGCPKCGKSWRCKCSDETLEEYFRINYENLIIDFSLRIDIDENGTISFYIHPDGKDGKTKDYTVNGNELIPK